MAGCVDTRPFQQAAIMQDLGSRVCCDLSGDGGANGFELPPGVAVVDGLTSDEATAIALWNNPQFQADLAQLDVARADLVSSGMIRNPTLSLLFPVGPKQFDAALNWSLDAIWLRSRRLALSQQTIESIAESLVLNGLNLVRDTRLATAELIAAEERVRLLREDVALLAELSDLAMRRVEAGDISGLDGQLYRVELAALQNTLSTHSDSTAVARGRLTALMGGPDETVTGTVSSPLPVAELPFDPVELTALALAARPDLRAAELAIEAAGEKLGLEKMRIFDFIGIVDANGIGEKTFEIGPGLQLELPIFHRKSAGHDRALAEFNVAGKRYAALRETIVCQVRESAARYSAASNEVTRWKRDILPAIAVAVQATQTSVEVGQDALPSLIVMQRRHIGFRIQEVEAEAELRRAAAQLSYSIGSNCDRPREN